MIVANQLSARDAQDQRDVSRAFEDAGAVSPATARPLHELPGVDPAMLVPLVARRLVRATSDGRYYLHAGANQGRRIVVAALTALVLFAGPVIIMQLMGR